MSEDADSGVETTDSASDEAAGRTYPRAERAQSDKRRPTARATKRRGARARAPRERRDSDASDDSAAGRSTETPARAERRALRQ